MQESNSQLMERASFLREKVRNTPEVPGVYMHRSQEGEVLYVGKAKNLRNRLRSYFYSLEKHSSRIRHLVKRIYDFEVFHVNTEFEALILENNLIKHHQPFYNVLLRDDKTYPYLKLTVSEPWPRLILARQRKKDKDIYFGPFPMGGVYWALVTIVNRYFKLIKCTPQVFKTVRRPCNYYDIKQCLGPCHLPVDKNEYHQFVDQVIRFLKGETKPLVKDLKVRMLQAAEIQDFERAASVRDQIFALQKFQAQQAVQLLREEDWDVIGCANVPDAVCFYVLSVRRGKMLGGKGYLVKRYVEEVEHFLNLQGTQVEEEASQSQMMLQFLCQYTQANPFATKLLIDTETQSFAKSDREQFFLWVKHIHPDEKFKIIYSDDSNKKELSAMLGVARDNARSRLSELLQVEDDKLASITAVQSFLNMESPPYWIECVDISTFQGTGTVSSTVVFKNGIPSKKDYRCYIMKSVMGQNDFASMVETLSRRFKQENDRRLPDLLVIDGGEPQLREVIPLLVNLGLDHLMVVGLSKARTESQFSAEQVKKSFERLIVPARKEGKLFIGCTYTTLPLKRGTREFRVLTQVRDEAHRFAIKLHRNRRDKKTLGIEEKKKKRKVL